MFVILDLNGSRKRESCLYWYEYEFGIDDWGFGGSPLGVALLKSNICLSFSDIWFDSSYPICRWLYEGSGPSEYVLVRWFLFGSTCSEKGRRFCCFSDGSDHVLTSGRRKGSCVECVSLRCFDAEPRLDCEAKHDRWFIVITSFPRVRLTRCSAEECVEDNKIVHLTNRSRELIMLLKESQAFIGRTIDS